MKTTNKRLTRLGRNTMESDAFVAGMKKQERLRDKETKMSDRLLRVLNISLPHEGFKVVELRIWSDLIKATIKSSSGKEYNLEAPTFKLMMEGFFDWIKEGIYDLKCIPDPSEPAVHK